MGAIYLNEEAFGGNGIIIGDSIPSPSSGEEGSIYIQTDKTFVDFQGEFTSNRWVDPLILDIDMTTVESIYIDYTENNSPYKKTVNLSDFILDPNVSATEYSYKLSSYVYLLYLPQDPTYLKVGVDTGRNLKVFYLKTTHTTNQRLTKIFGYHNDNWLEYIPD